MRDFNEHNATAAVLDRMSDVTLSYTFFKASDQVCPAALQAQDGLNSCR